MHSMHAWSFSLFTKRWKRRQRHQVAVCHAEKGAIYCRQVDEVSEGHKGQTNKMHENSPTGVDGEVVYEDVLGDPGAIGRGNREEGEGPRQPRYICHT